MNEWQLMYLLSQESKLEVQVQRDPRAITHLIRIDEDTRGLPPSSKSSPIYLQLQGNLGNVFSQLRLAAFGESEKRNLRAFRNP
jgi:hypothetical protein